MNMLSPREMTCFIVYLYAIIMVVDGDLEVLELNLCHELVNALNLKLINPSFRVVGLINQIT